MSIDPALTLAVTSVMLLWELRYLWRLRKHDQVLYPICQIRRDLISLIAHGVDEGVLSRDDYVYSRWLLETANSAIALYRDHKTRMFNFRTYTRFLRQYRESAEELLTLPRSANVELLALEDRLNRALSSGFMTYTPGACLCRRA